jgi:Phage-related protein
MTTSAPQQHLVEAQKLTADALVDLYELSLKHEPVVFRFRDGPTVQWQGKVYEGMACTMSGDMRSSEGEESRPVLRVMNPFGIFNQAALNSDLDLAIVTRKRLLRRHLEENVNIFEQRKWYVGRVRELISGQVISLELRSMTEGANFQIPVRMFIPPDFPFVTL